MRMDFEGKRKILFWNFVGISELFNPRSCKVLVIRFELCDAAPHSSRLVGARSLLRNKATNLLSLGHLDARAQLPRPRLHIVDGEVPANLTRLGEILSLIQAGQHASHPTNATSVAPLEHHQVIKSIVNVR